MKKLSKHTLTAALLAVVMLFAVACTNGGNIKNTAEPKNTAGVSASPNINGGSPSPGNTSGAEGSGSPMESPSGSMNPNNSPEGSEGPLGSDEPSGSPNGSAEPGNTDDGNGDITGFVEGKVIDQDDAQDVVDIVKREFANRSIQSIVFEEIQGRQAYKVTLQGEGELAKNIYILGDGSVIIPSAGD
ncbi:MAG: hypothetical protein J1E60_03930 [Christensenellaceae bacterium]|nr:hypothetical protein [Christensenellaceae bacterium]